MNILRISLVIFYERSAIYIKKNDYLYIVVLGCNDLQRAFVDGDFRNI